MKWLSQYPPDLSTEEDRRTCPSDELASYILPPPI